MGILYGQIQPLQDYGLPAFNLVQVQNATVIAQQRSLNSDEQDRRRATINTIASSDRMQNRGKPYPTKEDFIGFIPPKAVVVPEFDQEVKETTKEDVVKVLEKYAPNAKIPRSTREVDLPVTTQSDDIGMSSPFLPNDNFYDRTIGPQLLGDPPPTESQSGEQRDANGIFIRPDDGNSVFPVQEEGVQRSLLIDPMDGSIQEEVEKSILLPPEP